MAATYLKREWLDTLREIQTKWGGDLSRSNDENLKMRGITQYSSLTTQISNRKIYLSREPVNYDIPLLEIVFWLNTKIELVLTREGIHDKFLKMLGLDYEISLPDKNAETIAFNGKFLIKGTPQESISRFLCDYRSQELVNKLGDFVSLRINSGKLIIIYDIDFPEIIRSDRVIDTINNAINFIDALERH